MIDSSHEAANKTNTNIINGVIPTALDQTLPPVIAKNSTQACALQNSCESCYNYSNIECHWCAFDHACHGRASPYGCIIGAPCSTRAPIVPPSKAPHQPAKSCKDYTNCKECALSSWGCHWCRFDDKCHAVGSIYGCTYGVNCYSNQQCQRSAPEYVYNNNSTSSFGVNDVVPPLFTISSIIISLSLLGCFTLCFCGVRAVKGAYEDMVMNTAMTTAEVVMDQQTLIMSSSRRSTTLRHVQFSNHTLLKDAGATSLSQIIQNQGDDGLFSPSSRHHEDSDGDSSLSQSLLAHNYPTGNTKNNTTMAASMLSRKTAIPVSSNANSIMRMCGFCYCIVCILVIVLNFMFLRYFPKIPVYNVCSDELDWRSIVDGMTSAKIGASFQILFSIYNPNRFDLDLKLGSGTLNHDGTYVGRFDIPPETIIAQQAISDLLVTITLRPDKWEALALTTEYYKGTLSFEIDMSVEVSAPFLGGYSYQANFDNYLVHLSDTNTGRKLCACPQWKDVKPPLHPSEAK